MVQSHGCSNTKFPTVRPCITRLLFKLLFDDHLFTRSHGRFTQQNRSVRTNMRNHRRPLYQPALSVSLSKNTQQRDRHTTRTNNDCSRGNICATGSSGFVSGVLRSLRNTTDGVIVVIFSIFIPVLFFHLLFSIQRCQLGNSGPWWFRRSVRVLERGGFSRSPGFLACFFPRFRSRVVNSNKTFGSKVFVFNYWLFFFRPFRFYIINYYFD